MTSPLVAGVVAGYGIALPVGAVGTYLVGLGARERLRTAAAAALGVATTDAFFALVARIGGAGLQAILRHVATPLSYLAAASLIVLAVRTVVTVARRPRGNSDTRGAARPAVGPLRAYAALLALTAVNPTTLIYFAALVLGGQPVGPGPTAVSAVAFTIGVFVASASWQLLLACSGAVVGRVITTARGQLTVASVSAAIVIALAGDVLTP